LYGALAAGGPSNAGGVFRLKPDGSGFTTLLTFSVTNGAAPQAGLALGTNGDLFGTTYAGGISNCGTIYKINTNGTGFQVLHHFLGGSDGKNPSSDPFIANNGFVYGVTYFVNATTRGTVYRIDQNGNNYSVIHTFTGTPDGQQPRGRLCQGTDGMLYGTTVFGGTASQLGTIYRIGLDGAGYSVIHALQNSASEGQQPNGGVCQSADGFLYGTVYSGGSYSMGAVFRVDTNGNNFAMVRDFRNADFDGQHPNTELVESADGFLYGGTYGGGPTGLGTVFKIKNDGTGYTVLQGFFGAPTDPYTPNSLVKGANGALYGTTQYGGGIGAGCIYALTTSPLHPRIVSWAASANSNVLEFAGTYGIQYDVLRSSNLTSWSVVTNFIAPQYGGFSLSDLNPPRPSAFYRLRQY
jgi:uncharacterized repeat protein (TIGR03803 family)